ncbi:uncharacterized protein [Onthophagus taurus]|uniref:uncharacterized protein n=1 Tax=Onthophagus taurus TaxID=166361 RepID=UPI0039BDC45B
MTLDTPPSEEFIKEVIFKIFQNKKNVSYKIEPGSNVGDGFLGITASITVNFEDEIKHIFMKMASKNNLMREHMFQRDLFQRESYFYSKVLFIMKNLYEDCFKKEFLLPDCYYTCNEDFKECIVLENLSQRNYNLIKSKCFDKNQLLTVLHTYSQLHACGFMIKLKNPDEFEDFSKKFERNYFKKHFDKFGLSKVTMKSLDILKKSLNPHQDEILLNKFDEIKNLVIQAVNGLLVQENYSTIIHQDCWRNNIMFKYDDNKILQDIKLIDFQMWCVNTPIFDVAALIYTNTASKEILDNLNYYLTFYYNSLSDSILKMGGDPLILYPKEIFNQQWKKHNFYGLWIAIAVVRGLLAPVEMLPNLVEYVKNNIPLENSFMFDLPDENEYCDRLKLLLYHFIENKYV